MKRVAINGFGRIGRMVFRAGLKSKNIEFIAINDLTDTKTLAHLLKYDSTYGRFPHEIKALKNALIIDGRELKVYNEKDPKQLPWKKLNIDVVVESTGFFRKKVDANKHIKAGAKKVLISAPANVDFTIVKGVNEHKYDPKKHHIISNASCTTNCLAPIVKVLNDNYGVEQGFMTTIHAYTGDQRLLDAPHKDLRRSRTAANNIIPTTTGAAKTVTAVIPSLKGKLDGMAVRVPVQNGSITDFVCTLKKKTTIKEINRLFKSVSKNELKNVIKYTEEPIVSSDIIGNPNSSIFDALSTNVCGTLVKIIAWYDNEWGYSNRMIDVLEML